MNRRVYIIAGLAVGLVAVVGVLQYTGTLQGRSAAGAATGTSAGCEGGMGPIPEVPIESPDDVFMGPDGWTVPDGVAAPDEDAYLDDVIPGQYVVSVRPEVAEDLVVDGQLQATGFEAFDAAFANLEPKGLVALHREIPKDRARAEFVGLDRTFLFDSDLPADQVLAELEALEDVDWAEPLMRVDAFGTPNDPYYGYQWHLSTIGMGQAWDVSTGNNVIVAVVDTGVSAINDGYSSLLSGYDFVDDDADASDENGHGTHVAGTIAQKTNNRVGVAGMAYDASILPVRVLDADGSGTSADVASGVIWAVDNGAQVINMSLGSNSPMALVEQACAYAAEAGVLVVAAAGNDGYTAHVSYPAAYSSALAVSATDLNGDIAYYSNRGEEIELAAPGGDVTADQDGDGYGDGVLQETFSGSSTGYYFFQGTSMAAPHVAGLAALLIANGVTELEDLREALTSTAADLGDVGFDTTYGYGLMDPVPALEWTATEDPTETLEMLAARAQVMGRNRALLQWRTRELSTTEVEGDDGFSTGVNRLTRNHRVLVRGQRGTDVIYTITSSSESGATGAATLEVSY